MIRRLAATSGRGGVTLGALAALLLSVLVQGGIEAHTGGRAGTHPFLYLEQIYGQVITELDPHYLDPYLIGALIMNAEARKPEMALALLDRGIARNPDQWILAFEAGFLCYNDLKDY